MNAIWYRNLALVFLPMWFCASACGFEALTSGLFASFVFLAVTLRQMQVMSFALEAKLNVLRDELAAERKQAQLMSEAEAYIARRSISGY
jgi:hypothetical protein